MKKILFVDTLATGMNPERCSIYRIGGIYTEDGVEKRRFDFRMQPFHGARMSDQSLWIGGEDRATLARYPANDKAFESFVKMLDSFVELKNPYDKMYIAGFNSSAFDVPFIREWFRRNANERFRDYFHVQTLDLMTIASFIMLDDRKMMPDFKLDTVSEFLGQPVTGDSYDCVNNAFKVLNIYRSFRTRLGLQEFDDRSESKEIIKNI